VISSSREKIPREQARRWDLQMEISLSNKENCLEWASLTCSPSKASSFNKCLIQKILHRLVQYPKDSAKRGYQHKAA